MVEFLNRYMERCVFWYNAGLPADMRAELELINVGQEEPRGRLAVIFRFKIMNRIFETAHMRYSYMQFFLGILLGIL